jgi:hypothetical protein
MNSYFLMYEFISGGAMCEVCCLFGGTSQINAAYHYYPDQLGCVRLPRPVRVRSAAPGVFGCPDRGCGLEMGIGSRTGYI